jgi:hypothetical protein
MPVLPGKSGEMAKKAGKEEEMRGKGFVCDCPPKSTWKWGRIHEREGRLTASDIVIDLI